MNDYRLSHLAFHHSAFPCILDESVTVQGYSLPLRQTPSMDSDTQNQAYPESPRSVTLNPLLEIQGTGMWTKRIGYHSLYSDVRNVST